MRRLQTVDSTEERSSARTIEKINDLLLYLLPRYQREGKSYLTIGIGCTGGRHRSVMVANSIRDALKQNSIEAFVTHRDMKK